MKTRTFIAILWGIAAVSFIGCSTPRKLAGSTKETTKTEEVNTDTDKETDITEKPAADPYRWRYIFGILVLLAVAFFFLRKTKVFTAVAAFFRKLF